MTSFLLLHIRDIPSSLQVKAAGLLKIPVIATEQYPKGEETVLIQLSGERGWSLSIGCAI